MSKKNSFLNALANQRYVNRKTSDEELEKFEKRKHYEQQQEQEVESDLDSFSIECPNCASEVFALRIAECSECGEKNGIEDYLQKMLSVNNNEFIRERLQKKFNEDMISTNNSLKFIDYIKSETDDIIDESKLKDLDFFELMHKRADGYRKEFEDSEAENLEALFRDEEVNLDSISEKKDTTSNKKFDLDKAELNQQTKSYGESKKKSGESNISKYLKIVVAVVFFIYLILKIFK